MEVNHLTTWSHIISVTPAEQHSHPYRSPLRQTVFLFSSSGSDKFLNQNRWSCHGRTLGCAAFRPSARWHCQLVAMETPVYDTLAAVSLGMTQHNIVLERERERENPAMVEQAEALREKKWRGKWQSVLRAVNRLMTTALEELWETVCGCTELWLGVYSEDCSEVARQDVPRLLFVFSVNTRLLRS